MDAIRRRLSGTRWLAAGVISLLTLAIVGGLIVAATPAGCKLGIQSSRCQTRTASLTQVGSSPSAGSLFSPSQYLPPPTTIVASSVPLTTPAPTRDPSWPPYQYDASASYPPNYSLSSQSFPGSIPFSCRLPLYAGPSGSGGFLSFPSGQWTADPRSNVSLPSPPADFTPPPQGPGYQGGSFQALTYDRAYSKWLPIPRALVSPDGKRYAYTYFGSSGVYVVDVTTGAQIELGEGQKWQPIDTEAEGVYAEVINASGQQASGLWLLPFSGSPREITTDGYWSVVGAGAAYGTSSSAVPQGAANTIVRVDLKTGAIQSWFTVQNGQSQVIGTDNAGNPIIQDFVFFPNAFPSNNSQIWIVPGLAKGYVIENNPPFNSGPVADSHGIWFPGGNQTFLFVPGQGTFVAANVGGQIAGDCV
jgi:hypothetical protein